MTIHKQLEKTFEKMSVNKKTHIQNNETTSDKSKRPAGCRVIQSEMAAKVSVENGTAPEDKQCSNIFKYWELIDFQSLQATKSDKKGFIK